MPDYLFFQQEYCSKRAYNQAFKKLKSHTISKTLNLHEYKTMTETSLKCRASQPDFLILMQLLPLNFQCSLDLSGSKVGQSVIKISSAMVHKWTATVWGIFVVINFSIDPKVCWWWSLVLSSFYLSSLYHFDLCIE